MTPDDTPSFGGGSSDSSGTGGTSNYNELSNKPSINGVALVGNKTLENLGIQPVGDYAKLTDIPTKVSQLSNDKGYLTQHQDLTNYATKTYVDEQLSNVIGTALGGSY